MDLLLSTIDSDTKFEIFYFLKRPVLSRDSHKACWKEEYLYLSSEVILSDFGILFNWVVSFVTDTDGKFPTWNTSNKAAGQGADPSSAKPQKF